MTRYLLTAFFALFATLAPALAADMTFDDPVDLVTFVYEPYLAGETHEDHHALFSPTLETLLSAALARGPDDEAGALDFDPLVNGQDVALSDLKVQPVESDGKFATVEASFKNLGERQRILFMLIRREDGWKINDLQSIEPGKEWRLSVILAGDLLPH